jgi:ribosomal-protein-alanine N-acetyltransferase
MSVNAGESGDLGESGRLNDAIVMRTATEADLDQIMAIEQPVFGRQAWSRELLREELIGAHRRYLVAVDPDDLIVGYAGLLAVGEDGDVQTIALTPATRGAGIGRALMNELLDEAERRSVRRVFLEVRADNPVARSLYASLGFAEIGRRAAYYQPEGVDAIVMKLEMGART